MEDKGSIASFLYYVTAVFILYVFKGNIGRLAGVNQWAAWGVTSFIAILLLIFFARYGMVSSIIKVFTAIFWWMSLSRAIIPTILLLIMPGVWFLQILSYALATMIVWLVITRKHKETLTGILTGGDNWNKADYIDEKQQKTVNLLQEAAQKYNELVDLVTALELNVSLSDLESELNALKMLVEIYIGPKVSGKNRKKYYEEITSRLTAVNAAIDARRKQIEEDAERADQQAKESAGNTSGGAENSGSASGSVFFAGCTTKEQVQQRYRTLAKAYHPDSGSGDTETFEKVQAEYEALMKTF